MKTISEIRPTGWFRRKVFGQKYHVRVWTKSLFLGDDFDDFFFSDYIEAEAFKLEFFSVYK